VLQLGLPRLDAFLLFEGLPEHVIRAFLDPRVRMVGIDFRLHFHVDRCPELRRLVDDREPVFIDRLTARFLECLFIHRNDLATRAVT